MAKSLGEKYFLVLISNIKEKPEITIINDPYKSISPKKYVYPTIAVGWSIDSKQIKEQ